MDCENNMKIKDLCSKYKLTNYAINKLKSKLGIVKIKSKQSGSKCSDSKSKRSDSKI